MTYIFHSFAIKIYQFCPTIWR